MKKILMSLSMVAAVGAFAANTMKKNTMQNTTTTTETKMQDTNMQTGNMKMAANTTMDTAPVLVGGAKMFSNKNIVENAKESPIHHTLVKAVVAADLVPTLTSDGPFTVFAPTDAAFAKLDQKMLGELLKNKTGLAALLKYHVISGKLDSKELIKRINEAAPRTVASTENRKMADLTTVNGAHLWAYMEGKKIMLRDEKGTNSAITVPNVWQKNGVIHVVDTVVSPGA